MLKNLPLVATICLFFLSLQSLSGHTSPVEAVRFRPDEKAVVAGSLSGAVKIWDLEAVKSKNVILGSSIILVCSDYSFALFRHMFYKIMRCQF